MQRELEMEIRRSARRREAVTIGTAVSDHRIMRAVSSRRELRTCAQPSLAIATPSLALPIG